MKLNARVLAVAAILVAVGVSAAWAQSVQSRGIGQAQAAAAASQAGSPPAQKPAAGAKASPAARPGERRDPFRETIQPPKPGGDPSLNLQCGPGIRSIIVGQVELNGVARGPGGIIAVVTTTNTGRTYFLRDGNTLCNGKVTKITADSITFDEEAIDPLGKAVRREVIRKIPGDAK